MRLTLLVITAITLLSAQSTDGLISGAVRDPSGAIIAGARLEIRNANTGVTTRAESNAQGIYSFPALAVGQYRITATHPGFQTSVLENIRLDVGARLALDFTLAVAAAGQSVEVVAEAKLDLAYATSSVGGVLTEKKILDLPLTSRNAILFATTQAGTFGDYFSGARIGTLNIQVDGVNIQDSRINQGRATPFFLSTDRVAEFRVVTSPADAEYGRGSGQIQMITRSGTNDLHGSLFEFHRNTVLNANTWFNNFQGSNANGQPIAPRNFLIRNQYGARAGGPVVLPKLYKGKNRTFFHFLWEAERIAQRNRVTRTVYTESARRGLYRFFPGAQNANATANIPVVDFQGNPVAPRTATGPLSSVNVYAVDPLRSRPDPSGAVQQMLGLMPLPNVFNVGDGLNTAGYAWIQPASSRRDQYNLKLDHNFNDRHRLSFSWNREDSLSLNGFQSQRFPNAPGGNVDSPDSVYSLKLFSILRPNLLNEFTVGALRSRSRSLAPWEVPGGLAALPKINGQPYLIDLLTVTDPILVDNDPQGRISPNYQWSDTISWLKGKHNIRAGGGVWFVSSNGFNSFDVMPRVVLGNGIQPVQNMGTVAGIGVNRGGAENLLNNLAGSVSTVSQALNAPGGANPQFLPGEYKQRTWKNQEYFLFFKDDYRLSKNTTLNLGLRYEYFSVPYDPNGKTAGLAGGGGSLFGISGRDYSAMFRPGAAGGALTQVELIGPGSANPSRQLFRPDRNNFSPHVGLSWAPSWLGANKTILRLGYSMGYERTALRLIDVVSGDQPGLRELVVQRPGAFTPLGALSLPLRPNGRPLDTVPFTDRAQTVRGFEDNLRTPYVQNFNVSLQRSLPTNLLLDVRYVGNKGTRLMRTTNLNEVNVFETGLLDAFRSAQRGGESPLLDRIFQPLRGTASGATFARTNATLQSHLANNNVGSFANFINTQNVGGRNGGLLSLAGLPENFFVVNPQFSGAQLVGNYANSSYHSFQVDLSKRFSNGVSMQMNYTWAKALGEEEGAGQSLLDSYRTNRNRRLDKRQLSFGAPHVFRSNWIWNLPIGPKRRLLGNTRGWAGRLLENWQVGALYNVFSGTPMSWESEIASFSQVSDDTSVDTIAGIARQGQVTKRGNGVFFYPGYTVGPDPQVRQLTTTGGVQQRSTLLAVFDASGRPIATNPAPGTLGALQPRFFYGPGYFAFDLNLLKTFTIREGIQFQLGVTADNITNTPAFEDPDIVINSPTFGQIGGASGNRIVILSGRLTF